MKTFSSLKRTVTNFRLPYLVKSDMWLGVRNQDYKRTLDNDPNLPHPLLEEMSPDKMYSDG